MSDTGEIESPTEADQPPPRISRPQFRRRITRPTFMVALQSGSPVGEYEIEGQIGEGAMGTVYAAVQPLIGKRVAIKVLKPELCANQEQIDRFVQEAQAVNKIGHPNIVDVFSLGELPDGRAYFVMEWLRGEDLKTRLARGPMPVQEACDILDGIARALGAAHAKGIIHRDLKPDNVFLHQVDNGPVMVKLLDFGIAKLVRPTPGTEKTQTGNMLGTPRYISPEQARGINVDHRADIYSLGVMAYEVLAGRPPFHGESAMDLVVQHLSDDPPPLSQFARVPKPLEQCVMRMLGKEPVRRPSLDDVRAILVDPTRRLTPQPGLMSGIMAATSAPMGMTGQGGRTRSRWLGPVAAAAIVLLACGVTWRLVSSAAATPVVEPPALAAQPATPAPTPHAAAAPLAPAAPAPGTLEISVTGANDAMIWIDGAQRSQGAFLRTTIEPGLHDVEVRAAGHPPEVRRIDVATAEVQSVTIAVPVAVRPPSPHVAPPSAPHAPTPPTPPARHTDADDELLRPVHH